MNATFAANTMKSYRSAWRCFERWCQETGSPCLPTDAQTCVDYAAWNIAEGFRLLTVENRLKAINFHHRQGKFAVPCDATVAAFMRNARRDLCERSQGKLALSPAHLRKVSQLLQSRQRLTDIRNRALITLCFACGWRRSEIVSLDLRDLDWVPEGVILWLGKSKTDQEGEGRYVGVHYGQRLLTCPIAALKAWLDLRGSWAGPLFTALDSRKQLSEKRLNDDALRRALRPP